MKQSTMWNSTIIWFFLKCFLRNETCELKKKTSQLGPDDLHSGESSALISHFVDSPMGAWNLFGRWNMGRERNWKECFATYFANVFFLKNLTCLELTKQIFILWIQTYMVNMAVTKILCLENSKQHLMSHEFNVMRVRKQKKHIVASGTWNIHIEMDFDGFCLPNRVEPPKPRSLLDALGVTHPGIDHG